MKRVKSVFIALVILFSLATIATTATSCTGGKVCYATKVGNHK